MGLTVFFDTIYGSYCLISANFYLYLQYFQQNKRILNSPLKQGKIYSISWLILNEQMKDERTN